MINENEIKRVKKEAKLELIKEIQGLLQFYPDGSGILQYLQFELNEIKRDLEK